MGLGAFARYLVAAILAVPTIYFATVLFPAIQSVSLSEGFDHILSNVWATCALIDYVTGLTFTLPYMWFRSPNALVGCVVVLLCFGLGNVFSVALFIFYILTGNGSLRQSILPLNHQLHAANTKIQSVVYFQDIIGIIGLVYWIFLIYSLVMESVPTGWSYISADTWSYVTFVDVLTGVSMVATYILVRELYENTLYAIVWLTALLLLGNGVTVLYLLYLTNGPMAGRSLKEIFLWGGPDPPSERAPLVKDT